MANSDKDKKKKLPSAVLFMLFVFALLIVSIGLIELLHVTKPATSVDVENAPSEKLNCLIVLDAGHGGMDCGAIGKISGVHEDVLNLDVAKKLQKLLEDAGARVIMTRETNEALASTKSADMEKRRSIISSAGADIVVSIHMNFFSDMSSAGPQVFYYEKSEGGRTLATHIQSITERAVKAGVTQNAYESGLFCAAGWRSALL